MCDFPQNAHPIITKTAPAEIVYIVTTLKKHMVVMAYMNVGYSRDIELVMLRIKNSQNKELCNKEE